MNKFSFLWLSAALVWTLGSECAKAQITTYRPIATAVPLLYVLVPMLVLLLWVSKELRHQLMCMRSIGLRLNTHSLSNPQEWPYLIPLG